MVFYLSVYQERDRSITLQGRIARVAPRRGDASTRLDVIRRLSFDTLVQALMGGYCARSLAFLSSYGAGEYFVGVLAGRTSRFVLRVSASTAEQEISTHLQAAAAIVDNLAIMAEMSPEVSDARRRENKPKAWRGKRHRHLVAEVEKDRQRHAGRRGSGLRSAEGRALPRRTVFCRDIYMYSTRQERRPFELPRERRALLRI